MTSLSGKVKANAADMGDEAAIYAAPQAAASQGGMTRCRRLDTLQLELGQSMGKLLWGAIRAGLWGLLLGPLLALLFVIGLMVFDPACSSPGDSGGCAMGLVTAPLGIALPSFGLLFAIGLAHGLWQGRPRDWRLAIRRLRTWGRED